MVPLTSASASSFFSRYLSSPSFPQLTDEVAFSLCQLTLTCTAISKVPTCSEKSPSWSLSPKSRIETVTGSSATKLAESVPRIVTGLGVSDSTLCAALTIHTLRHSFSPGQCNSVASSVTSSDTSTPTNLLLLSVCVICIVPVVVQPGRCSMVKSVLARLIVVCAQNESSSVADAVAVKATNTTATTIGARSNRFMCVPPSSFPELFQIKICPADCALRLSWKNTTNIINCQTLQDMNKTAFSNI